MTQKDFDDLVVKASLTFRLDANLIRAIITVESGWDNWSMRFEPSCTYSNDVTGYANKNGLTHSTEEVLQHSSFGLMQIMGVTARDFGFTDKLTMLCQPNVGIFYGCKKLRALLDKYGNEEDAISAYNAGTPRKTKGGFFENQQYLDKVYAVLRTYRKLN